VVTGATPADYAWDGVDDLTCEVVETAADLLGALRKGYADPTAARPLRTFATTMCVVVAHLSQAEQLAVISGDGPTGSPMNARSELARQAFDAWRSAVFALNDATAASDSVLASGSVGALIELEPTVARLLDLREELVTALARVEPAGET
jgi:hypothetical protein